MERGTRTLHDAKSFRVMTVDEARLQRVEALLYSVIHEKSISTTIYKEKPKVDELLSQVKLNEGLGND